MHFQKATNICWIPWPKKKVFQLFIYKNKYCLGLSDPCAGQTLLKAVVIRQALYFHSILLELCGSGYLSVQTTSKIECTKHSHVHRITLSKAMGCSKFSAQSVFLLWMYYQQRIMGEQKVPFKQVRGLAAELLLGRYVVCISCCV